MPRVLLIAATTGYQIRSFGEAAERLDVELVLATDRCHVLDDPWRDNAIAIRFQDEVAAVEEIRAALIESPVSGVLAVGDRPALIAALTAEALKLRGSPPDAVRIAGNKLLTRIKLREAELPVPWFTEVRLDESGSDVADRISFPCVVKPLTMSASRGVMRVDTLEQLEMAMSRISRVLERSDVEGRDPSHLTILAEQYLPGGEVAVEGVLTNGVLQTFAVFDKPDPLEGPFFEETIYVTPSGATDRADLEIRQAVSRSAAAFGLTDGPVHAECRIGTDGVFVLEVAPRPIGGLCAKALQFLAPNGETVSLEEVLLRQALAEPVSEYRREDLASGVMMIPIPGDGLYKNVVGLESARAVDHIEEIVITAHRDQRIRPLPEGGSYLGFIFARAELPAQVESALRSAHRCLKFEIAAPISIV
jgi:biotin carboxylase